MIPSPDETHTEVDNDFVRAIMMTEPGCMCGRAFATATALATHQRFANLPSHNVRSVPKLPQIDNECLVCGAVFATRAQAGAHLERSWTQGALLSRANAFPAHSATSGSGGVRGVRLAVWRVGAACAARASP